MIAYFSDQFITFGVHIIWDVKPIVLFDYSRSYNIFNAIRLNNLINVTIDDNFGKDNTCRIVSGWKLVKYHGKAMQLVHLDSDDKIFMCYIEVD